MAKLDTVLIKVASRCNIDCRYCYVYHSPDKGFRRQPARMSLRVIDTAIERLVEQKYLQKQDFAVVLHGGEPLLLGKSRLNRLLRGLRSSLGSEATIALQTNGTLLDDNLVSLFAETRTRVAVSIDGPANVNDRFRLDRKNLSTFSTTVEAIKRLRDHSESAEFFKGVLAVVDPFSDPEEVYRFFKELGVPSVDFLYRDGNHDRLPFGKNSLESREYGEWMARLWDLYIEDREPVPIECLDNLFRGLFGRKSTKEGTGNSLYSILVVETDGSIVKNDTLKNSYDGADQFNRNWSIMENSFAEVLMSDEFSRHKESQRANHATCRVCPWLSACGGGMLLHRWSDDSGYDNPSVYCEDQKFLCRKIARTASSMSS
ncbi:MAG: radical SAM protein [Albidovulum sp.]|nr:radical SAM protein [Albidovulum sp.]